MKCIPYCMKQDTDVSYDIFESQYGFGDQKCNFVSKPGYHKLDVDIIALKYGDNFTYREIGLILEHERRLRSSACLYGPRKKLETMIQKGV